MMAIFPFTLHQKKHIFRIILGLLIAGVFQYFLSSSFYWIPLATLLVMLTRRGSALYQGLCHFFILILVISLGTWIFEGHSAIYARAEDILIGAIIGIMSNLLIFPDRVDIEFREIIMPLLDLYDEYFQQIAECMIDRNFEPAEKTQMKIEEGLLTLPTFVYEPGFDITMQKGHQYFFMKMEHLSEILFTLHHVARYAYDENFISNIRVPLSSCVSKIHAFMVALQTVLSLKQLPGDVEDFYAEIAEIEEDFKHFIPFRLDGLDLEKQFVFFALFLRALKEFHDNLLILAKTLR